MKKLLSATVICAMLMALPALAESPGGQAIDAPWMGLRITPPAEWQAAIDQFHIVAYDEYDAEATGYAFSEGRIVLAYMADAEALTSGMGREEAIEIIAEQGVWLIDVTAVAAGRAYTGREGAPAAAKLGAAGGYEFYYQATEGAPDEAGAEVQSTVAQLMAALPAPGDFIAVSEPIADEEPAASISGLGAFDAVDLNGNAVTPAVFSAAKLTMVNIWATYCGPCITEMPDLQALSIELKDRGFQIVGIVTDVAAGDEDSIAGALEVAEYTGTTYPHIIPDQVLYSTLLANVSVVPTTVFVDAEGNLVGSPHMGSRDKAGWLAVIEPLLDQVQ